jgi:hypothetical protein
MAAAAKEAVALIPPVGALRAQRDALAADVAQLRSEVTRLEATIRQVGGAPLGRVKMAFPAGHFYSPIPDLDDLDGRDEELFGSGRRLRGIDLAPDRQLALLDRFKEYYADLPYGESGAVTGLRYRFDNPFFSYGDGIAFYSILRDRRPRRVLEVGSGWSSALALDVNERFLDGQTELTFIEPFTERLASLLRAGDSGNANVIAKPLRDVDPAVFDILEPGDVLFIDSTHVSRVGSDVNQLILDILPALGPGVHVHVHDVFHPFEYPKEWILDGRAWNEIYLLQAFLTHNDKIRVNWFNSYLFAEHRRAVADALPLWERNCGGSFWFETVAA